MSALLPYAGASEGEKFFRGNCIGCHTIEKGGSVRQGPNLWGVLGRKKGSVEDFSYSAAFGRLVGTWTLAEFNAFIGAPTDYAPGTKMQGEGDLRVKDAAERANLIAFLRQNSDDPPPLPASVAGR